VLHTEADYVERTDFEECVGGGDGGGGGGVVVVAMMMMMMKGMMTDCAPLSP
jgi:hypothetical protein